MKIFEIIVENELEEGFTMTIRDAKKILTDLGFAPLRWKGGSHQQWGKKGEKIFPVPQHGKDLDSGALDSLKKLMKKY